MASNRNRPTSPHASLYRLPIGMRTSIIHRLTAVALSAVGTPILTWYLLSIAMGEQAYDQFRSFASSWIGTFVLFGLTWSILQHFASGMRHLVMDFGKGFKLKSSNRTALATYVFSFLLTVILWTVISLR
ncbi:MULTISPECIES: succinate dehydrogenase, cytochrome b556 subunit [Agrobacterium]|uniref:succinate dehydrogenase, cytochrome b556 subunit n=1 Tax=Agrobacterium tumefaciens TaxID=358 RepID=UPI000EF2DF2B|nr:hypothetical protein At1D1108_50890 [Agrobacterium tumefaciens]NSY09830.1 succinate dehydrogenase, cytochrome b556 subunit [Agrobacterium tumefaciens]NSY93313.1 succinate dehydrogenase, cytochrome b556 subunit [Agrobacterium tumefaciens]